MNILKIILFVLSMITTLMADASVSVLSHMSFGELIVYEKSIKIKANNTGIDILGGADSQRLFYIPAKLSIQGLPNEIIEISFYKEEAKSKNNIILENIRTANNHSKIELDNIGKIEVTVLADLDLATIEESSNFSQNIIVEINFTKQKQTITKSISVTLAIRALLVSAKENIPLSFGVISVRDTPCNVMLNPDSKNSFKSNCPYVNNVQAGVIELSSRVPLLNLPTIQVQREIIISNGKNTLTINNTKSQIIEIIPNLTFHILVGGNLNIGSKTPVGVYKGTYSITIIY
jgi:hypothetical protein